MSEVVKAQGIVDAIKDVIKHKTEQLANEKDPARKNRAEEHLKAAQDDLKRAEANLAKETEGLPQGEPVAAPVVGKPAKAAKA